MSTVLGKVKSITPMDVIALKFLRQKLDSSIKNYAMNFMKLALKENYELSYVRMGRVVWLC